MFSRSDGNCRKSTTIKQRTVCQTHPTSEINNAIRCQRYEWQLSTMFRAKQR
jgi:hypothetical protein